MANPDLYGPHVDVEEILAQDARAVRGEDDKPSEEPAGPQEGNPPTIRTAAVDKPVVSAPGVPSWNGTAWEWRS